MNFFQKSIVFFLSILTMQVGHAASLINISSWGFASSDTPHISCGIVSGSNGERVSILVYGEANRQVNGQTDPIIYIGRPGDPLDSSSNYFINDDWETDQSSTMISSVGRTPAHNLDSGVILSAPVGPVCIYGFDRSSSTDLSYINLQLTFLGNSSDRSVDEAKRSNAEYEILSQDELVSLIDGKIPESSRKIMPNNIDNIITIPRSLVD
uniref:Uncharacterized protein n=1 Tax=uncultured Thiotrichaceae bacterium TaxID=298394 RepID=A0A6S6U8I9_9GAMM|nr:MAG: Unknown protein [uncultured Thiotrichaceae bacterium]